MGFIGITSKFIDTVSMRLNEFEKLVVRRTALGSLILLPVFAVYAILYREMTAVPLLDDYNAILAFLLHLQTLSSFGDKLLYVVTAEHNGYRLIFEHFVIWIQFALERRIDFTFLILFGNLFLLILLAIHWKQYFAKEANLTRRLVLFLPMSYLLFQLNYAEAVNWAMSGLQNITVIAFAFAAIHFLTMQSRKSFMLACLCMGLSCMSSANGFLTAPVGLLMLFPSRNYKRMALWIAATAFTLGVYLYRYVDAGSAAMASAPLFRKALFLLSFMGAGIENMHHFPVKNASMVLGALILFTFGHALSTRYYRDCPFAFFSATWILLTAVLVANVRVSLGIAQSLSGRYKIYCDLLLVFCYGYVVHQINIRSASPEKRRRFYAFALTVAVLISTVSDIVGYKFLVRRRERLEAGLKLYLANPSVNSPMLSPNAMPIEEMGDLPELARIQMTQAIQRGIYIPPTVK